MSTEIDGGKICASCKGGCCSSCGNNSGYYSPSDYRDKTRKLPSEILAIVIDSRYHLKATNRDELIQEFAKKVGATFTKERGFLGPKGCTIPREHRSWTCRFFYCDALRRALGIEKHWVMVPNP